MSIQKERTLGVLEMTVRAVVSSVGIRTSFALCLIVLLERWDRRNCVPLVQEKPRSEVQVLVLAEVALVTRGRKSTFSHGKCDQT